MDAFTSALTAVTATGNLKQIYKPECTPGPGTGVSGTQKRQPCEGVAWNVEVKTDGVNGGTIELYDMNGADVGADVDTLDVITNAQLTAAVAAKKARLMWSQQFAGSGTARLAVNRGTTFAKGLAARFSNAGPAGTCTLNVQWDGGERKIWIAGL